MNEEKKEINKKDKLTLKERWKDKRERAKIQLCLYGIFFVGVIVFANVLGSYNNTHTPKEEKEEYTFLSTITDNYEYDTKIIMNSDIYNYHGKSLGHNTTIKRTVQEMEDNYYKMDNKYYILDSSGNYILINENEVYPYIEYRYLNIDNIKEYMKLGVKENNTYKVKLSDITLSNDSDKYITITTNELDLSLIIDYTELFKLSDINITNASVKITYSNIGKIISLS